VVERFGSTLTARPARPPAIRRAPAALDRVVTALMRMGAGHGFSPLHPRPRR
jgi:hypothetical protein